VLSDEATGSSAGIRTKVTTPERVGEACAHLPIQVEKVTSGDVFLVVARFEGKRERLTPSVLAGLEIRGWICRPMDMSTNSSAFTTCQFGLFPSPAPIEYLLPLHHCQHFQTGLAKIIRTQKQTQAADVPTICKKERIAVCCGTQHVPLYTIWTFVHILTIDMFNPRMCTCSPPSSLHANTCKMLLHPAVIYTKKVQLDHSSYGQGFRGFTVGSTRWSDPTDKVVATKLPHVCFPDRISDRQPIQILNKYSNLASKNKTAPWRENPDTESIKEETWRELKL